MVVSANTIDCDTSFVKRKAAEIVYIAVIHYIQII